MLNHVLIGPGSSAVLADVIEHCGHDPGSPTRTALIVSAGFDNRAWSQDIRRSTRPMRPTWFVHRGAVRPESVADLASWLHSTGIEVAVAVGGGSVLDLAKAAAHMAGLDRIDAGAVVAACTGDLTPPPSRTRLVAVPTTPGTGAEVTPFATVWDVDRDRKLSLSGDAVTPSAAILDPDLLRGLDAHHLCAGLLDTLCQGAEAAWSVRATAESTSAGLAAVTLAGPLLRRLDPARPSDSDLFTLQLAGHLSGRAIASVPTSSCHAISYPLTLRAGLAHGHACGVTFGRMLRYNAAVVEADCTDARGARRVRKVVDRIVAALAATTATDADRLIDAFLERNGLATLDDVPVEPRRLARAALDYPRAADNPRALTVPVLTRLLARRSTGEDPCG